MDMLRRFAPSIVAGAAAGLVALAALLAFDTNGLRGVVLHDQNAWIVLSLLACAFAGTFASAALGLALMELDGAGAND